MHVLYALTLIFPCKQVQKQAGTEVLANNDPTDDGAFPFFHPKWQNSCRGSTGALCSHCQGRVDVIDLLAALPHVHHVS